VGVILSSTATPADIWVSCLKLGCISRVFLQVCDLRHIAGGSCTGAAACRSFMQIMSRPDVLRSVAGVLIDRPPMPLPFGNDTSACVAATDEINIVLNTPLLCLRRGQTDRCLLTGGIQPLIESGLPRTCVKLIDDEMLTRGPRWGQTLDALVILMKLMTEFSPRVGVREGFASAMCKATVHIWRCDLGGNAAAAETTDSRGEVINCVCETLEALIKYGEGVMDSKGEAQNKIATQILQLDSVKALRERQRRGKKGKQKNVLTKLLDLFDDIESAETKRYDKVLASISFESDPPQQ